MKKAFLFTAFLASAVLVLSCGKEDNIDPDSTAYEQDMGHPGSGVIISNNNQLFDVTGTPWKGELWCDEGSQYSLTWWENGTFRASWNDCGDYIARVGFRYPGSVSHTTRKYSADYNYVKTGSAGLSYIGAYGWTTGPITEWYIVDDWYTLPENYFYGKKMGEYVSDGEKYTLYIILRENAPSNFGTQTFIQIFSFRATNRQKGHMDLNKHFNKFAELLHNQTESVPVSSSLSKDYTVAWGNLTEVSLGIETLKWSGNNNGTIEYNHFGLKEQ